LLDQVGNPSPCRSIRPTQQFLAARMLQRRLHLALGHPYRPKALTGFRQIEREPFTKPQGRVGAGARFYQQVRELMAERRFQDRFFFKRGQRLQTDGVPAGVSCDPSRLTGDIAIGLQGRKDTNLDLEIHPPAKIVLNSLEHSLRRG